MPELVHFGQCELVNAVAVGATTAHRTRIWVRADRPGELAIRLALARAPAETVLRTTVRIADDARDGTLAFNLPLDGSGERLRPCTRYLLEVHRRDDGTRIGTASFETSPEGPADTPTSFSFAAMSCHQPFDNHGRLDPGSLQMLRATRRALHELDTKFLFFMGDQIYADYPPRFSFFSDEGFSQVAPPGRKNILECTREEVRALYHRRHRIFWSMDDFQRLQAEFPTYPMLDDHEVVDNFGTDPKHAEPAWANLRAGALDAFHDYQVSRVLDPSAATLRDEIGYPYSFHYGPCAFFVMDVRSTRRSSADATQIYSPAQLAALERFLRANAAAKLIVLVISVPLLYLPSWLVDTAAAVAGTGSDVCERWNHKKCHRERDRLLRLLHAHQARRPDQKLLLLGGDIHVGCAFRLAWEGGGPPLYQLTSSALSNRQGPMMSWLAERVSTAVTRIEVDGGPKGDIHVLESADGAGHNPYGGLNVGVVHVHTRGSEIDVELQLVGAKSETEEPISIFRSGPL